MTVIAVLVSVLLQKFFQFHGASYRHEWIRIYYKQLESKVTYIAKGHRLFELAILVIPLLFGTSLLLALIYHLFGALGYFIVNLALFWLCTDIRDLRKYPLESSDYFSWFAVTYRDFFAPLFWFVFLGPVIMVLYVVLGDIYRYLESERNSKDDELMKYALKTQAVLDWIPARLLGMTYALVGHFKSVLSLLKQQFFMSPFKIDQAEQLALWARAALQPQPENELLKEEVISLIERALLIWIIVLIILTISFWLG